MIFAEILHEVAYEDFYYELLEFIRLNFSNIHAGLQGDGCIEIKENGETVKIDTFDSMQFQIKANSANSSLAKKLIDIVKLKYEIDVFKAPIIEAHENFETDV